MHASRQSLTSLHCTIVPGLALFIALCVVERTHATASFCAVPLASCPHVQYTLSGVIQMQYGEDAIKEGMGSGGGGGGMGDIFDILSGGGGRRQQPRERRGENVVHRLKVSLEEMYSGGVRKLSLSRNIKCDTCGGSGTKSGKRYQCEVGFLP